jgi:hypothetical protein
LTKIKNYEKLSIKYYVFRPDNNRMQLSAKR